MLLVGLCPECQVCPCFFIFHTLEGYVVFKIPKPANNTWSRICEIPVSILEQKQVKKK